MGAKLFPVFFDTIPFMNIVILGNVCIDHNANEKAYYEAAGGPATFMSLFFDKTGDISFTTISSYGVDFLPYKDSLSLSPLNPNNSNTLVYENTTINGKRSQKCHFHRENLPPEIDENIASLIKNADILFITPLIPYFSPEYIKKVVKLAHKNCLKILLPQGYFRKFEENDNVVFREFEEADKILLLVDFVILSSEDYSDIEDLSFKWSGQYGTTFIITTAERGALIINKNGRTVVSTIPIPFEEIVDSIGAGDIFSASFGYNYFKDKDLEKSVHLANESAREKLLAKTKEIKEDLG